MEIQHRKSELLAASEFIQKSLTALSQFLFVRSPEIYELAVVRQNLSRRIAQLLAVGLESLSLLVGYAL